MIGLIHLQGRMIVTRTVVLKAGAPLRLDSPPARVAISAMRQTRGQDSVHPERMTHYWRYYDGDSGKRRIQIVGARGQLEACEVNYVIPESKPFSDGFEIMRASPEREAPGVQDRGRLVRLQPGSEPGADVRRQTQEKESGNGKGDHRSRRPPGTAV